MNFPPLSVLSRSFCNSVPEAKRALDGNIVVSKGTPSNDILSLTSVTRRAARTSGVVSWRKIISGDFGPSRIWQAWLYGRGYV